MKFRLVSLLFVGILFGLASVASADLILNMGYTYETSFNALDEDIGPGVSGTVAGPDGTTLTTVQINPLAAYYRFHVTVLLTGLAADQDLAGLQVNVAKSGGVNPGDGSLYVPTEMSINPPKMPAGTGSDAPAHSYYNLAFFNGTAFVLDMWRGSTQTGNGNGTYGDYMAYMELGEPDSAVAPGPFDIGYFDVTATDLGTMGFNILPNPGKLNIISANTNGLGVLANESFPAFTGHGDTVTFIPIPEPSSLALLGCGLFGLLAYAWRKRK
jgi:hypothetical protein